MKKQIKINYILTLILVFLYWCYHSYIDRQQPSQRTTFRQVGSALLRHFAHRTRPGHL